MPFTVNNRFTLVEAFVRERLVYRSVVQSITILLLSLTFNVHAGDIIGSISFSDNNGKTKAQRYGDAIVYLSSNKTLSGPEAQQKRNLKPIEEELNKNNLSKKQKDQLIQQIMRLANPYYSITNKKGNYRIQNVPEGDYQIHVWHTAGGSTEKHLSITEVGYRQNFAISQYR